MPESHASIDIEATPEAVWAVLADVTRWPAWTPTMTDVQALDSPVLQMGSAFRVLQPRLSPAVWRVTSLTPNEEFTWAMSALGVRAVASHRVVATSATTSDVTLGISFSGWLAPLIWRFVGELTKRYLITEAAALKTRVENARRSTGL